MADQADGPSGSVTLHSSWKSLVLSFLGALAVFGVGLASTINTEGAVIPIIILVLGVVFLTSVLFDSPVASTFTTDGVQRRPLLRRHFIAWDRVGQLTRTRPSIAGALKGLTPGGMAVKVGRRRYLLVDQCEALREFQELVELLENRYVTLGIDEMVQPPEAIDPTWTYRRKRWLPDG
ncbi:hypothetical protein [Ilumatobacter sp.]|uniref:hypothetical protein n=1 Tax=Ilumatobacter sp. TaxID=1967498 RepID=UPI003751073D